MSVAALPGVPESYRHYPKQATPLGIVTPGGAELKLYEVTRADEPVPLTIRDLALARLDAIADKFEPGDRGFVILHRCGADFHFLLPTIWRGANEAWEAVEHHHGEMPAFAPFDPAYPTTPGAPRPTFCVWEMGVVAHEAMAWGRFLSASREADARVAWRDDVLTGAV